MALKQTNYDPSRWVDLLIQLNSLLLFSPVLKTPAGKSFCRLIETLSQTRDKSQSANWQTLPAYTDWFHTMAVSGLSWPEVVVDLIGKSINPFSQQAQAVDFAKLPSPLQIAASRDLRILQQLFLCQPQELVPIGLDSSSAEFAPLPAWDLPVSVAGLPDWAQLPDWGDATPALASYYRQHGTGLFAEFRAARWQAGEMRGIVYPDTISLAELVGYELPKQTLLKNTECLLAGAPALNVLLYGSRGTGKSSLVKALLTTYAEKGLRLIEVPKSALFSLPQIIESLRGLPQKFIIFVDDLSFEADDEAFKALKVVLEGNLTARPINVVVYATSNRRHLVREYFSDRPRPSDADEVHAWDSVQEQLSFSDRFGLTLTFEPANQDTYLEIVFALATGAGISLGRSELEFRALQWATRHNGRSGRTARQFVDYLLGEEAIKR